MVFTALKLVTLAAIIVLGYFNFNIANYSPFFLEDQGGFRGTFVGASIIYFGFMGFDFITTLSEDAKNPVKDIPVAVRNSNLICGAFYVMVATSLTGMAHLEDLSPNTAMADAFSIIGYDKASLLIYFCAFCGLIAACFSSILAQPKVLKA